MASTRMIARVFAMTLLIAPLCAFSPVDSMRDTVDVRDFGAKCDGMTDDSAAFTAMDAKMGIGRLGIYAICRLSANVTLTHTLYIGPQGALSVDETKTLTIASVHSDATTPFPGAGTVINGTPTTAIKNATTLSVAGLSRIGQAINSGDWLETYIPPSTSLSQFASIATAVNPKIGGIGVTGAARSSDFSGAGANAYGLAAFCINDHPSLADVCWSGLFLAARRNTTVGATLGIEINATNTVNNIVDVAPFAMFPSTGITAGIWIAPSPCSFPAGSGICASPTFNTSTAIGIVSNGANLVTGTTHGSTTIDRIASTSTIVVGGPINGECVDSGTIVSSKADNSITISNAATCSATITFSFSSVHRKGITFDAWSLDPSVGPTGTAGVALEMGQKQVIRWSDGSDNSLMSVWTDASGVLQLAGSNMTMKNSANTAERITLDSGSSAGQPTYMRYQDRGLPWWDIGKTASNQFAITNVQTGKVDLEFDTADVMTLPNLGSVEAGTGKRFLCIDTVTKIIYEGSGASCN